MIGGRSMADFGLENRVAILETQMKEVRDDIKEIKTQVKEGATKGDLVELKGFFDDRDQTYTKNMWKVIYGLLVVLVALLTAAWGLKEIPKLF